MQPGLSTLGQTVGARECDSGKGGMQSAISYDSLTRIIDANRGMPVSRRPAWWLYRNRPSVTGQKVANVYGPLIHYASPNGLDRFEASGSIGPGCYLTPARLSACMVPYSLGLTSPKSVAIVIDVSRLPALWGPGTVPASTAFDRVWQGGGIEFYCDLDLTIDDVLDVYDLLPCGDG
jgi:hypothetical protein